MIRLTVFRVALAFAALLILCVLARPVLPVDETRYLAVAWEMHLSQDIFHLTRNFAPYAHKPPLLFWLINLVWLIGGSEFAARLVGPAFAVIALVGTAALARRIWEGHVGTGIRAAAILSGFLIFALYGSATMFDTMLTLAVLTGIAALWSIGEGQGNGPSQTWGPWVALGLAFGLGTYAKGPVILVHLVPLIVTMRLWAPHPPSWGQTLRGTGLALAIGLALVALWLIPALVTADAAYRKELLWTQSFDRVAGGMAHDRPFWFLWALLPVILFPWGWSWRLWRALAATWRTDAGIRLCGIWAISGLILFSFVSSKQAHYLVPELPALAMIFGRLLSQPGRVGRGLFFAPMMVLVVAALAMAVALGGVPKVTLPAGMTPQVLGLFAATLAALAVLALRLPFLPGHLAMSWGIVLALHGLIYFGGIGALYDSRILAGKLAANAGQGLAITGDSYSAEVNFALRATQPIATPQTPSELRDWATVHPQGLVFGPIRRAPITAPPTDQVSFNGEEIGIWPAGTVAVSVRE